jgi:hypothetical protein
MIGFAGFMKADVLASETGAGGIRPIESAPGFDAREVDVKSMAERYFDFIGNVDIKLDDRIVIDDGNFYIAPGKSVSNISQGDKVGIRVNGSGEVIEARRLQK